jgi:hypothetical protein
MKLAQLLQILQATIELRGSCKNAAIYLGVSPQYLSDVMRGRREPGESILNALNLRKEVSYVAKRNLTP